MKKFLAFLLVVVMMLSICACGKEEKNVSGTWTYELDLTETMAKELGSQFGTDIDLQNKLIVVLALNLTKDGTYKLSVNEDKTTEYFEPFLTEFTDVLIETIYVMGEAEGVSREEMDAALLAESNMDVKGTVTNLLSSVLSIDALLDEVEEENGFYKVKGNKLMLAESKEDLNEKEYIEFKLEGNSLSLISVSADADDIADYLEDAELELPIVLAK